MAGIQVDYKVEGLERVLAMIPDDVRRREVERRLMLRIGATFERSIKEHFRAAGIQSHTSGAIGSIKAIPAVGGALSVEVQGAKILEWLDRGTGVFGPFGQRIYPKTAKVLAWHGGSMGPSGNLRGTGRTRAGQATGWAFARSIAGMKGRPFIKPGLEAGMGKVEVLLAEAARELSP